MNEFWLTIRRRLLFSKLYPTTSQYLPQIAITGRSQPRRTSPEPIELSYRYSYIISSATMTGSTTSPDQHSNQFVPQSLVQWVYQILQGHSRTRLKNIRSCLTSTKNITCGRVTATFLMVIISMEIEINLHWEMQLLSSSSIVFRPPFEKNLALNYQPSAWTA